METRSRVSNKQIVPVEEVREKKYDEMQQYFDNLKQRDEEINRLIELNTLELAKYRSEYFKNKQKFNKCKDNKCYRHSVSVTLKDTGICTSYISQCDKCKSFYLRELVPDYWGENYSHQDV
jgi:hypothetical protein